MHLNCGQLNQASLHDYLSEAIGKINHAEANVLVFLGKVDSNITQSQSFGQLLSKVFMQHPLWRVLITTASMGALQVPDIAECVVNLKPLDEESAIKLFLKHCNADTPEVARVKSAVRAANYNPYQIVMQAKIGILHPTQPLEELDASAPYLHVSLRSAPVVDHLLATSCLRALDQKLTAFKRHFERGTESPVHIRADLKKLRPASNEEWEICEQLYSQGCFGLVWCTLGCGWDPPSSKSCPRLCLDDLEKLMRSPKRPRLLVVAMKYGARKVCAHDLDLACV